MPHIEHEYCKIPDLDTIIWRYMNLKKFKLLLSNKSLFFCRTDIFSDPYEGTFPRKEMEYIKKKHEDLIPFNRSLRSQYLVNCWHINNNENDAMWRLYLKNNKGIAIKTTVRNLIDCLKNTKEDVYCSFVNYKDYEKDEWDKNIKFYNTILPIIHKRKAFEHENELRLIHHIDYVNDSENYWKQQPNENGKNILIDLNKLIECIYTAPTSFKTDITKVKEIINENGFDFKVEKSILDKEPYY
jgi:hypothetical protein